MQLVHQTFIETYTNTHVQRLCSFAMSHSCHVYFENHSYKVYMGVTKAIVVLC